jgi:hypothetical protein
MIWDTNARLFFSNSRTASLGCLLGPQPLGKRPTLRSEEGGPVILVKYESEWVATPVLLTRTVSGKSK